MVTPAMSTIDGYGRPLDDIMGFAPLREAFGEFCRKALCAEVIQAKRVLHLKIFYQHSTWLSYTQITSTLYYFDFRSTSSLV